MKTVSAAEAEAKFSELIDAAAKGETVTVTRDGKPVVQLVPASPPEWRSIVGAMKDKGPIPSDWKDPGIEEMLMMGLAVYESDPLREYALDNARVLPEPEPGSETR